MGDRIRNFGETARGLARSPLGIIRKAIRRHSSLLLCHVDLLLCHVDFIEVMAERESPAIPLSKVPHRLAKYLLTRSFSRNINAVFVS
jgi:hypothetical protein